MHRLPVALLCGLLLVTAACAVSKPPKARLTDNELEQTTANPRPEDDSASQDQSLPSVKQSAVNIETTGTPGPALPAGAASPVLPVQGGYPWFPR